jgi:hypothetical protein
MSATDSIDAGGLDSALGRFNLYDRHVDVVSAFEWLYTSPDVEDLPETVLHFERFPRVRTSPARVVTPDFTILFKDGSGLVGEIAEIALHENSIDKLCKQLLSYDSLSVLPDQTGAQCKVSHVDVALFVSLRVGPAAVERIIVGRLLDDDNAYAPSVPPMIVQYARDDRTYSFQRIPHEANGIMREGEREPKVQPRLDQSLNIQATRFTAIKAARSFINDSVDPLYLATHLWTKTWPSLHGRSDNRIIEIDVNHTAKVLRAQHGLVRTNDVKRSLELLARAALAHFDVNTKKWYVAWGRIARPGEPDIHKVIAGRAYSSKRPNVPRPLRELIGNNPDALAQVVSGVQDPLF